MDQSNFYKRNVDSIFLKKIMLSILFVIIFTFIVFSAIKTGNYIYLAGVLSLPLIFSLVTRLDIAYVIMSVLAASLINIDRGGYLPVSTIFVLYISLFLTLSLCIRSDVKTLYKISYGSKYLITFLFITLLIMVFRGTGIRTLGSDMWGGSAYIMLITSIIFYVLVVPRIILNRNQIKFVVIGGFVFSIIGAVYKLLYTPSSAVGLGITPQQSLVRADWLIPIIYALLPLIFASITKKRKFVPIIFYLISLSLVMLTGYRSRLVMLVAIAFGFGYFKSKTKSMYILKTFTLIIIGWISTIVISPILPDAMQRAISFIPGVSINYQVALNAQDSNTWRVEIWKYAMIELEHYWIIGRGLAFNVKDALDQIGLAVGEGNPFQNFHTHNYHSGPITLLIDFGLPGLICGLFFTIFAVRRTSMLTKSFSNSSKFEEQYFLFLCVSLIWYVFSFWFVFGDPRSFNKLILLTSHVLIIHNSLKSINKVNN